MFMARSSKVSLHSRKAQALMMKLKPLVIALAAFSAIAAVGAENATKPNILVILVDDMGFSDIGCYGSEIPTPNIDKLGFNGLRFTQFYNAARCCPSRASLLTGLYPHQAGMGGMVDVK